MKKTIIGIMIMAVAIMMTLSSAVFAAGTVAGVDATGTVGETVTVTINHPAGAAAGQYDVKYDPTALEYVGDDVKKADDTIRVAFMDTDYKAVPTHTLTFKTLKAGTSNITISGEKFTGEDGQQMTDITVAQPSKVVVEEAKTPVEPTNPGDNNQGNNNNDKNDQEIDNLGDAKTGFDAMYVVYLAVAVLVAAGIVTVAKRK